MFSCPSSVNFEKSSRAHESVSCTHASETESFWYAALSGDIEKKGDSPRGEKKAEMQKLVNLDTFYQY